MSNTTDNSVQANLEPTAVSTQESAVTTPPPGPKKSKWAILFNRIKPSKWNRSYGAPPDEGYIKRLAADLRRHGQFHPVTLIPNDKIKDPDGPDYMILAGVNRVGAQQLNRGADGGLLAHEFVIRDGLDESSADCLEISISENAIRRDSPPAELALYVARMLREPDIGQERLGKSLGLRRETVNRLAKLNSVFDKLPESWRSALSQTPNRMGEEKPVLGIGHWFEVAGSIGDDGVPTKLVPVLEAAAADKWTTNQLREAVGLASKGQPWAAPKKVGSKGSAEKSAGKPNILPALVDAERHLRQAAELLQPLMAEQAASMLKFAETLKKVIDRVVDVQAKRVAAAEAERKQKQEQADADRRQKAAEKAAKKERKPSGRRTNPPVNAALLAAIAQA